MSAPDFWKTLKGLLARLADIAHHFTWSTYNTTTREIVASIEADPTIPEESKGNLVSWVTHPEWSKSGPCEICDGNEGDYEADDPLFPDYPAHVNCVCTLDIMVNRSEPKPSAKVSSNSTGSRSD